VTQISGPTLGAYLGHMAEADHPTHRSVDSMSLESLCFK
jgi:hypothetical protein